MRSKSFKRRSEKSQQTIANIGQFSVPSMTSQQAICSPLGGFTTSYSKAGQMVTFNVLFSLDNNCSVAWHPKRSPDLRRPGDLAAAAPGGPVQRPFSPAPPAALAGRPVLPPLQPVVRKDTNHYTAEEKLINSVLFQSDLTVSLCTGAAELGRTKQEKFRCYLWTWFSRWLQDRRLVGGGALGKSILQEARGERTSSD